MHRIRQTLIAIDSRVYRLERALLLVALVMMTALVFSDVIIRTFTRPVGKTASFLIWLFELGGELSADTRRMVIDTVSPATFVLASLLMCIFAAHASRRIRAEREETEEPRFLPSAAVGTVFFAVLTAGVQLTVYVFPTGIAGAQKFALGFMVWAGFLGASLATRTRRHIVIDAVKKKLDNETFPIVAFVGALFTAGFTGWVAYLAAFKSAVLISEWHESEGRLHVFESFPVPEWVVTLALPTTLFLSALRFLAYGAGELLWGRRFETETDAHGINFDELAQNTEAKMPNETMNAPEAGMRLYGTPHRGAENRLSSDGGRA